MSQHYSILPTLLNWYVERVTLSWVQCSSLHRSWNWYVVVVLVHGWKTAVVSVGPSMPSFRRRDRLPEPSLESELASSSPSIGSCLRLHQSACVSSLLAPDRDLSSVRSPSSRRTRKASLSKPIEFPFERERGPGSIPVRLHVARDTHVRSVDEPKRSDCAASNLHVRGFRRIERGVGRRSKKRCGRRRRDESDGTET